MFPTDNILLKLVFGFFGKIIFNNKHNKKIIIGTNVKNIKISWNLLHIRYVISNIIIFPCSMEYNKYVPDIKMIQKALDKVNFQKVFNT